MSFKAICEVQLNIAEIPNLSAMSFRNFPPITHEEIFGKSSRDKMLQES